MRSMYQRLFVTLSLFLTIGLSSTQAAPPVDPVGAFPVTDGQVNAIAQAGGNVFIGGSFSKVFPYTGNGVVVSTTTGIVDQAFPRVNGPIFSVVPDGNGGWFIGGEFTVVGTLSRLCVAHIKADKTVDTAWNANFSTGCSVFTMGRSGTTLYIAGGFSTIGGETRNKIGAVNTTTGAVLPWNPNAKDTVRVLTVAGSIVYVGGEFASVATNPPGQPSIGGAIRNRIAALDADTGLATNWDPGANQGVRAIVVDGNTVYVGGGFSTVGGGGEGLTSRSGLAALNASTGVATDWDPNAGGQQVLALAKSGNTVYAGGQFTTIGGITRHRIAAINANTGAATAWDPAASSTVNSIRVVGSTVYVTGTFTSIGGQLRNNVAALDANVNTDMALAWNPNANQTARAVEVVGSTVYIGGEFTSVGGETLRNNIAAFNATTGAVTAADPNANGAVHALAAFGNTVYVGGDFTALNGGTLLRDHLAALDATTGVSSALWNPGADGSVKVLTTSPDGNTVYAGGDFATVASQARSRIAGITASSPASVTTWNPGANGTVSALATTSNKIYVGGSFTNIASTNRNFLAFLKATPGGTIIQDWNPNPNGAIHTILMGGVTLCTAGSGSTPTVYIGGEFTSLNGGIIQRSRVAAIKSSGAGNTICDWNPGANGGTVRTLALSGDTLFMGGDFTSAGGVSPLSRLAAVDVVSGSANSWNPNANSSIRALSVSNVTGALYAGGNFATMSGSTNPVVGLPRNNFATFSFATLLSIAFPLSRSVQVGSPATAYMQVFNGTATLATNVNIAPKSSIPGSPAFHFWSQDPNSGVFGAQDTPVNIPATGQLFLISFDPTVVISPPTEVRFAVEGNNSTAAASISGWNNLFLGASTTATADIASLTSSTGVVIPGPINSGQALGVAALNIGATQSLTVVPKGSGNATPPDITYYICQSNPNTGQCLAALASSVNLNFASGATATFGVFVQRTGDLVPCDFLANRLFVEFREGSSTGPLRGLASVLVCTTG